MRQERDFIGSVDIPDDALYGIHSIRACQNFPAKDRFNLSWYKAMGVVKQACYATIKTFFAEVNSRHPDKAFFFSKISSQVLDALEESAVEMARGDHYDHFITPAISGGAGTSINMTVNEIITNVALIKLGYKPGDYHFIDPIETANLFQSTNDVVPTALKVSVIQNLNILEEAINRSRSAIERLEGKYRNTLRVGYTQMQAAVPSTYGRLFSAYADALGRDWWRVSKCFERLKIVNLGGSAIGTGLTVPRYFVMKSVAVLKQITNLPITRSENLSDTTSNLDSFVEVHAILKAHAVNLEKMVSDLRLLASDLMISPEIILPKKQVGSSIMPGKVNPVIVEYVVSVAHQIYANDQMITSFCAAGCLDLNAYIPIIGDKLLESVDLLIGANETLLTNLLSELYVDENNSLLRMKNSPSVATALLPFIGYKRSSELVEIMKREKCDIYEANKIGDIVDEKLLIKVLSPEMLTSEGFAINDLLEE